MDEDEIADVVETLTNEEKHVLDALRETGEIQPEDLVAETELDELVEVMNASSWLESKGLVRQDENVRRMFRLTDEGRHCVANELPERRALRVLSEAGGECPMQTLTTHETLEEHERGVAIGQLKSKHLVEIDQGTIRLTEAGEDAADGQLPEEPILARLAEGEASEEELRGIEEDGFEHFATRPDLFNKRDEAIRSVRLTSEGSQVAARDLAITEQITQLTPEILQSGAWKDADIRSYDVKAFASAEHPGKRHPMRDIIEKIRRIYLDMGFHELGGHYARSAFCNLDALFIPQDHPAREMQDTFYLADPHDETDLNDPEVVEKVEAVHEAGGDTGSKGWGGDWSREEARRTLLRTHTTVDTITRLAQNPEAPQRVFEIGRVFRKEKIDATHLPEFHQVEGIVVEEDASLDMLVGLLETFYEKMGFDDVRVRPAYFPYTEPSLEVEVVYNDEWLEMGGAGIFRPEVTEPLGVDVPVLAWGLGLERLAMVVLGLDDIRDLYMSDVEWLREEPMRW
ncbi:phenylalanine--tRNA ligase subunit alpha [Thermoplasmatales archaeon SW_10_69_26]|nr:MAG: phenylalanine--tRNA ligase subunit alpha [Thermoplasmatales archaeon SW_10_69_26]